MSFEQAVLQLEQTNAILQQEVVRFRDAAMGLNNIYATQAEGLAATGDGKYFSVPGNGAYMRLYRRMGSSAELISEFPDRDSVQASLDAVATHVAAADPHTQYELKSALVNVSGRGVIGDGPNLLLRGAYGLGAVDNYSPNGVNIDNGESQNGFWRIDDARQISAHWPFANFRASMIQARVNNADVGQVVLRDSRMWFRTTSINNTSVFHLARSTANTTVDSNGFIKQASPIFRLASDADAAISEEQSFKKAGAGAANNQAKGVTATHDDVGVYTVTGSLGFASEGWIVEVPQDSNGKRLCFVETEQGNDGTITVRAYSDSTKDTLVDIPDGRWIDLRLNMPAPPTSDHPDDIEPPELSPEEQEQARVEQLTRWRESTAVSRLQAKAALDEFGYYDAAQVIIDHPDTARLTKMAWVEAGEFRRMSPTMLQIAQVLEIDDEELDALFRYALTVEV